jgi:hypothetical protein
VFHKLSLEAIRGGTGSPVWLSDSRISAVASASIDRSTVDVNKGEMSFPIFEFNSKMDDIAADKVSNAEKLERLRQEIGDSGFPNYLRQFILRTSPDPVRDIGVHTSTDISGYTEGKGTSKDNIERKQGFFGGPQMASHPAASHHLKIFRNAAGRARLFYKYDGSIQFTKNEK